MTDPDTITPSFDYKAVFSASSNPYLLLASDLTILGANPAYLCVTGRRLDELVGRGVFDAFPGKPGDGGVEQLRASLERVLIERKTDNLALIHYSIAVSAEKQGEYVDRYWCVTNAPIFDEHGGVAMILHHTMDVTELQRIRQQLSDLESSREVGIRPEDLHKYVFGRVQDVQKANESLLAERTHLRRLFEQAPGFIAIVRGPEHIFELANAAYYQLVGQRELQGRTVRQALPELEGQGYYELLDRVYATGEPFVGNAMCIRLQHSPGVSASEIYIDFVYQPIVEPDGSISGIFLQGNDVSESHQLALEIRHQASHDALTGLTNRREFEQRLEQALQDSQQTQTQHSLLYIDLDQFKVVNDTCGHGAGDELLCYLSEQLLAWLPPDAILARLGGDEFGLLMRGCSSVEAQTAAEEIRALTAELEFSWDKLRFGVSASIGVVTFGQGFTFKEVLSTADSACFLAKEKGRNRVHAYRPDDDEMTSRLREMDWVSRLREALQEDRLVLHAQRIVPIRQAERLTRWEILIRLQERDGTIVPPMAFIPAAERYNLMPQIDRHVIEKAFRYLACLTVAEHNRTALSINLSGATLDDEGFMSFMQEKVAQYAIVPHRICLEITETVAIANLNQTAHLIRGLRALGFQFGLDDFGSGMSSFGYLKHLPIDFLKIDGIFVKDILDDKVDRAIVEAIANIAKVMNIETVAEYVENDNIFAVLDLLGVDYAQGYGVHRPEPLACRTMNDGRTISLGLE